jgi:hypothetical protein
VVRQFLAVVVAEKMISRKAAERMRQSRSML